TRCVQTGSTYPYGQEAPHAADRTDDPVRFVFPDLTVMENLLISARGLSLTDRRERVEGALGDYPILRERGWQLAGVMSGGQQRMVSLAMALMTRPRLLLLDEPSLGLSPAITEQIMSRVRALV